MPPYFQPAPAGLVKNSRLSATALKWCLAAALALPVVCAHASSEVGVLQVPMLFGQGCFTPDYEPRAAFDAPNGLPVGTLELDNPKLAGQADLNRCSHRAKVVFKSANMGRNVPVHKTPLSKTEEGLTVFKTTTYGNKLWVQGKSAEGLFWVPVQGGAHYRSLHTDLVQGLAFITEACDSQGSCQPLPSAETKRAIAAGAERVDTCEGHAYEVDGVVTLPNGRLAYKARLADTLMPKFGTVLKTEATVPVIDYAGRWTGFFNPLGCQDEAQTAPEAVEN